MTALCPAVGIRLVPCHTEIKALISVRSLFLLFFPFTDKADIIRAEQIAERIVALSAPVKIMPVERLYDRADRLARDDKAVLIPEVIIRLTARPVRIFNGFTGDPCQFPADELSAEPVMIFGARFQQALDHSLFLCACDGRKMTALRLAVGVRLVPCHAQLNEPVFVSVPFCGAGSICCRDSHFCSAQACGHCR